MAGLRLLGLALMAMAVPAHAQQATRDCALCPEMLSIPPGTYLMGAPAGEEEREGVPTEYRGWSRPQRQVTIAAGFALGRYEVTRAEYDAFVQATGYRPASSCWSFGLDGKYLEQPRLDWRNPGFAQTPRDPVVCINWAEANAYIEWLVGVTGRNYRLPSEAEWEYAARAGSSTARYWGDGRDGMCLYGNVADEAMAGRYNFGRKSDYFHGCSDGHVFTAPVGQFRPNAFGLHDMIGNVWEWTGDCWGADLTGAPTDGSYRGSAAYPGDCTKRVTRGSAWGSVHWYARAAARVRGSVVVRGTGTGFRVARSP